MAFPETIQRLADLIEDRRTTALSFYEGAADHLRDVCARLRFAIGDTTAITDAIIAVEATTADGKSAFAGMLSVARDLGVLIHEEPARAPLVQVKDASARLDELRDRIAATADDGQAALNSLAGIVRSEQAGTYADILRLAGAVQATGENILSDLNEAAEVGSCVGSA